MQAIGYVRVSTAEQARDGVSLDAQRERIAKWCEGNGYELVEIYADEGKSGGKRNGRDGLRDAIAATTQGRALVTYSMSRIARNTRDMLDIGDELERRGADLVSLAEKIDTTSAAGKMVFRMLAVLAEFERDVISERVRSSLNHLKANGRVYSRLPLGYANEDGHLVEIDEEIRVVSEIRQMRDAGMTYRAIAADLNERGIVGKRGGTFYASTIRDICRNDLHA